MKKLLIEAQQEIIALRRQNESQSAQLAIVDIFAAALGLRKTEGGMYPDITHKIEQYLDDMKGNDHGQK